VKLEHFKMFSLL